MIRGGTKLISLHKPSGRDSEGKLWATFLKCDAVPQMAKSNHEVKSSQTSHNQLLQTEEKMFIRQYRLPPDFLSAGSLELSTSSDKSVFQSPKRADLALRKLLEHHGVKFPDGSYLRPRNDFSGFIAQNTQTNLDLIDATVEELLNEIAKTLTFTTHVLQAAGPLLRRIAKQAAGKSNHQAELDELLAAVKTGGVQSLGTARIETKSGTRGTTQQGTQHNALAEVGINKEGVPEIFTESRHVGLKVELDPTLVEDGRMVELTLDTEFHSAAPFEHREHILDTQGRKLEFPLTDYHSFKVTTGTTMPSGTARLISLHKPTGKPEFEKEDILQAIFITCDILRVSE
jgi:hypothetical protein